MCRGRALPRLPAPRANRRGASGLACAVLAQVPLDVVCAYHERLVQCAAKAPARGALEWLLHCDEDERQWWADRHRHSSLTLGKIIEEGLEKREVMWKPPDAAQPRAALPAPAASAPPRPPRPPAGQQQGQLQPRTADTLKNGKAICRAFNSGSCSEPCPKDQLHVCSAVTSKSGHVCGMRNHGAHQCRRAAKASAAQPTKKA